MNLVREHIDFERGQDPLKAMGIGVFKIKRYPITIKEYKNGNFDRVENIPAFINSFEKK
jgi:hypothetical protein